MNQLAQNLTQALNGSREELITAFRDRFLPDWIRRFESEHFLFWLRQLEQIESCELPITKFGVESAKRSLEIYSFDEDESLRHSLWFLCEDVFCYSNDSEYCEMQGFYHFYYFIPDRVLFKESELGDCDLEASIENWNEEVRIATVSELGVPAEELLA